MIPLFCSQNDLFLSLPARTINNTGLNSVGSKFNFDQNVYFYICIQKRQVLLIHPNYGFNLTLQSRHKTIDHEVKDDSIIRLQ